MRFWGRVVREEVGRGGRGLEGGRGWWVGVGGRGGGGEEGGGGQGSGGEGLVVACRIGIA